LGCDIPSYKWLGYFQRQANARMTKPRPVRQSGSLSGNAQPSRNRLALTRQAVGEISMKLSMT